METLFEAKPSVFIGSSTEALPIARKVQEALRHISRPKLWTQGVFGLGWNVLDSLMQELPKHDFAILLFSGDDVVRSREVESNIPRDNVLFELGLFMGRLGPRRTFVLFDSSAHIKLMSDLAGLNKAHYDGGWASDDPSGAVGAACNEIIDTIISVGRNSMTDADFARLILELDTSAFTTPLSLEQSLVTFNLRVDAVTEQFQKAITKVDVKYHPYFRTIYQMLKALSQEAHKIPTTVGASHYANWSVAGITIDALRYAIVNQANELLYAVLPGPIIDNSRFMSEAKLPSTAITNIKDTEGIKAETIIKNYGLDSLIIERYFSDIRSKSV